jgi:hypothetical protein
VIIERCRRAASFTKILGQSALLSAKQRAKWAWRHRTKTAGSLTMAAGGFKEWAIGHPAIHLPGEGWFLIGAGAVVTAIGGYNTLAEIFGWKDDPPP